MADGIERSPAFARFTEEVTLSLTVVAPFTRKQGVFGIAVKGDRAG